MTTGTTTARKKKTYYIKLSNSAFHKFSGYKDIYDSLISTLGIVDSAPETATIITGPVSGSSRIAKINVKYESGSVVDGEPVLKTGRVLCAPNNVEDALQGLLSKSYKGKNIKETGFARRRLLV